MYTWDQHFEVLVDIGNHRGDRNCNLTIDEYGYPVQGTLSDGTIYFHKLGLLIIFII